MKNQNEIPLEFVEQFATLPGMSEALQSDNEPNLTNLWMFDLDPRSPGYGKKVNQG